MKDLKLFRLSVAVPKQVQKGSPVTEPSEFVIGDLLAVSDVHAAKACWDKIANHVPVMLDPEGFPAGGTRKYKRSELIVRPHDESTPPLPLVVRPEDKIPVVLAELEVLPKRSGPLSAAVTKTLRKINP